MKSRKQKFWARLGPLVDRKSIDSNQGTTTPISDAVLTPHSRKNPIFAIFRGTLTEQRAIQWLLAATIFVWITVAMIFACVFTLNTRPTQIGKTENTLREAAEANIKEVSIQRDHFDLFVVTTLQILYNIDDSGAAYRSLLQGSINPEILQRFNEETRRNLANIRASMLVQNLTINSILDFTYNEETGVVSAYIMGYISTIIQQSDKGNRSGTVPYRARLHISGGIKNNLSPLGFYLESLEDRLGEEALEWDKEELK